MSGDVDRQIAAAFQDAEEDRYRAVHQLALMVLRTIPNGTPDEELTPEQRQAWIDHDEAVEWLQAHRDEE